jgi:hypothetical protein
MKASWLQNELSKLIQKYGDLDIVVEVQSEEQIFETTNLVEYDTFEPGDPGYIVIQTSYEEI